MTKIYRLIFGLLLCGALFTCTTFGFAQNQQLAANLTTDNPAAGDSGKSATAEQPATTASKSETAAKTDDQKSKTEAILASPMETNKEVENPASMLWLLQTTMDNSLENVGFKKGYYNHSHLQFEPLLPNEINKHWTIGFRPVLDFYNSQPYPDASLAKPGPTGLSMPVKRMTSFGDMTLGIGVNPDVEWAHNWILCQGVTFIFPTATHNVLGQNNWQAGPLEAIGRKGTHYLGYILQQTWWKIGGNGQRTRQTWVRYTYFYNWHSGWSLGTQSDIFVNWQANKDQRVYFPVGLQVGKLLHAGPLPVKVDLQAQYYAVRPSYFHNTVVTPMGAISGVPTAPLSPKWNFQLQFTPIIPTIQEIIHHQIPQDPTRKKKA
jgi:hypothetical protein